MKAFRGYIVLLSGRPTWYSTYHECLFTVTGRLIVGARPGRANRATVFRTRKAALSAVNTSMVRRAAQGLTSGTTILEYQYIAI